MNADNYWYGYIDESTPASISRLRQGRYHKACLKCELCATPLFGAVWIIIYDSQSPQYIAGNMIETKNHPNIHPN